MTRFFYGIPRGAQSVCRGLARRRARVSFFFFFLRPTLLTDECLRVAVSAAGALPRNGADPVPDPVPIMSRRGRGIYEVIIIGGSAPGVARPREAGGGCKGVAAAGVGGGTGIAGGGQPGREWSVCGGRVAGRWKNVGHASCDDSVWAGTTLLYSVRELCVNDQQARPVARQAV